MTCDAKANTSSEAMGGWDDTRVEYARIENQGKPGERCIRYRWVDRNVGAQHWKDEGKGIEYSARKESAGRWQEASNMCGKDEWEGSRNGKIVRVVEGPRAWLGPGVRRSNAVAMGGICTTFEVVRVVEGPGVQEKQFRRSRYLGWKGLTVEQEILDPESPTVRRTINRENRLAGTSGCAARQR
ncbi:hypothetical protein BDN70DRAFT_975339, partial [Pholiota conissans]